MKLLLPHMCQAHMVLPEGSLQILFVCFVFIPFFLVIYTLFPSPFPQKQVWMC